MEFVKPNCLLLILVIIYLFLILPVFIDWGYTLKSKKNGSYWILSDILPFYCVLSCRDQHWSDSCNFILSLFGMSLTMLCCVLFILDGYDEQSFLLGVFIQAVSVNISTLVVSYNNFLIFPTKLIKSSLIKMDLWSWMRYCTTLNV